MLLATILSLLVMVSLEVTLEVFVFQPLEWGTSMGQARVKLSSPSLKRALASMELLYLLAAKA